ncbi:DUF1707 domain-containing protein [Actinomadura madurae]|uniref:DUF1707 SHOCT-like domain-containing protein n=1 Tax=Actinomadura madurae TaxID=1993 RepID=UPI0020D1FA96|nr:DUF1707 domain-containing protein [Actinomadura madurae]MCP9964475.1 DUF1707 domain-containing protein [Actinomadura madurae]
MNHPTGADHRTGDTHVRASDQDRDRTVQQLTDALTDGALDPAEHDRRLHHALTATTHGDLTPLTADLPPRRPPATAPKRPAAPPRPKPTAAPGTTNGATGRRRRHHDRHLGRHLTPRGGVDPLLARRPLGIWAAILVSYAIWPSDD